MATLLNKARDVLGNKDTSHTESNNTETVKTGPVHNHEALNKVDPRVHETKTSTDTPDASRMPPSVMQQFHGEPSIEHPYPEDSKHKRHSISHQEQQFIKGATG